MADEMRRCIGSKRFGIEPHDAPVEAFPKQPSQKDGLGRMCKTHWNAYTAGLARDAKARKTGEAGADEPVSATGETPVAETTRGRKQSGAARGNQSTQSAEEAAD